MAERILLFIPMYKCAGQIGRVIAQITPEMQAILAGVIVIDNRSPDNSRDVAAQALAALHIPAALYMNDGNYGLGGSHKVAFNHAIDHAYDYIIVLHGDDQGSIADIVPHLRAGEHQGRDALLGARFMRGARLVGYSKIRTLGNHGFNTLYSILCGFPIKDLGSGLNLYRVAALKDRNWLKNADDLTFNYHMIVRSIANGWNMRFFPLSWREADQVSNVKLVSQSLRVLRLPFAYRFGRKRYLNRNYSAKPDGLYPSTLQFENGI